MAFNWDGINKFFTQAEKIANTSAQIISATGNSINTIKNSSQTVQAKPVSEQPVTVAKSSSIPWPLIAGGAILVLFGSKLKRLF